MRADFHMILYLFYRLHPLLHQLVCETSRLLQRQQFLLNLYNWRHLAFRLSADVIAVSYVYRTAIKFFLPDH